jgi:quinohemoprotein ethanol dehydrogenase
MRDRQLRGNIRQVLGVLLSSVMLVGLAGCSQDSASNSSLDVGNAELSEIENASEWLAYGRTYDGQRFDPTDQINEKNVSSLGVDFFVDLPNEAGIVSTPLVANGVMYFRTSKDIVYAVDATDGKKLWTYDPEVEKRAALHGANQSLFYIHGGRGLAIWDNTLFTASVDGRLIALDPATGKERWNSMTLDPKDPEYIMGAPIAFNGKVMVGVAGTEFGANRGKLIAFDAKSGKESWRFNIVPGDPSKGFENKAMEMAAKTWSGEWWKRGGGGHQWNEGFNYDPDLNLLYITTGNGNPVPRKSRGPGDALFVSSLVALDADTGEYRWHYQMNPGEQWGYDGSTPMIRATLRIDGADRKVIMFAPKNGFFYVVDRVTGKLISAEPYTKVNWATKIDLATGRPVESPEADYSTTGSSIVTPGTSGARAWEPLSYNPQTGLVYIPSRIESMRLGIAPRRPGDSIERFSDYTQEVEGMPAPVGSFQAWDPVRQKKVWEVTMPGAVSPGSVTTGGNLVFHGQSDGMFVAHDAKSGKALWQYQTGLGISASPITYTIGGRQYVAILVGWGSSWPAARGWDMGWAYGLQTRRLIVFSLDGKKVVPAQPAPAPPTALKSADFKPDAVLAEKGRALYGNCSLCHGKYAISGGLAPDLRASPIPLSQEAFVQILTEGRWSGRMPSFKDTLTKDDMIAIQHYVRWEADHRKGMAQK